MGTFFHPITLTGPTGDSETVEALVDTGASFTTAPTSLLERLGVYAHATTKLTIASGEVVEWPWGWVSARIDGVEEPTPCVFGAEGAPPVIGAVTMEIMGLAVDPKGHQLVPRENFLMTLVDTAFRLAADFEMTGDQPDAVAKLVEGLDKKYKHQTLLGVTGSGKTFNMANVIARANRPTLVLSPNKTLAAQLYSEFRDFFPE